MKIFITTVLLASLFFILPTQAAELDETTQAVSITIALDVCCVGRIANGITQPPFVGCINMFAIPIDQYGQNLYDEKIYWQIHSTRNVGDHFEFDSNATFARPVFINYTTRRTITITASLYHDRSTYDTWQFTFDPRQPTISAEMAEGRVVFTQGEAREELVNITSRNLRNGTYSAYIPWVPEGMYIYGWQERLEYRGNMFGEYRWVRILYGEIEITRGAGQLLLYTTVEFADRPVTYQNLGISMEDVWFHGWFTFGVHPVLTEIRFWRTAFGMRPGHGDIWILPQLYSMSGRADLGAFSLFAQIEWTVTGMADGDDFFYSEDAWGTKYFYVGPCEKARTITITATARHNPNVYEVISIYIDPYFEFIPNRVNFNFTHWPTAGITFTLPGQHNAILMDAYATDGLANVTPDTEGFVFTMEGAAPDDVLEIGEFFVRFSSSPDPTPRFITVTAALADNPYVYDYLYFMVVPNYRYMPFMYIAKMQDNTITLHLVNISDGYHEVNLNFFNYYLWTPHPFMDWEVENQVYFTNGVGIIEIDTELDLASFTNYFIRIFWRAFVDDLGVYTSGFGAVNPTPPTP